MASIWDLQSDLVLLCQKCTKLKSTTAKKYAYELFKKYSDDNDGVISFYSNNDYRKQYNNNTQLKNAIRVLKDGFIESEQNLLYLKNIYSVEFTKNSIIIETTNNKRIIYDNKDFKYLKYVFKNF